MNERRSGFMVYSMDSKCRLWDSDFEPCRVITLFSSWETVLLWPCLNLSICIQLFRERLSEKMCTRQSRKVMWDMINTLFLTTVAVEHTFVAFLWHAQTYVRGPPCHFFKFLWTAEHSKPPTIPFGIVACTFSDNLYRNSCKWVPARRLFSSSSLHVSSTIFSSTIKTAEPPPPLLTPFLFISVQLTSVSFISAKIFQNWSTIAGFEESVGGFEPIRKEEKFWMYVKNLLLYEQSSAKV